MQRGGDPADLIGGRRQQMGAAEDQMDRLVDHRPGSLDDFLDGRVTATDDQHDAIRGIDRQRDFHDVQVDAPRPLQEDQVKSGCDLGRLGNPREVAFGPWAAKTQGLRRISIKVTHLRRQGFVALVEGPRQRSPENPEVFLGNVDLRIRVDSEQVVQAAGMVTVAMGHDREVELGKVDPFGLHVVCKDLGIVPGVEENAFATIFDERSKSPILLHRRGLAEGIVENGDLRLARLRERCRCAERRPSTEKQQHGQS